MKRPVLFAMALATLTPLLSSAAFAQVEHPKMSIGAAAATVSYVAPYLAVAKGFFKEEGVDVTIANFQGGSKALQAMMGGSVDVVIGAYGHTLTMASKGQKIRYFASFLRCPGYVVALSKGQTAKSFKDLKGLKVGVTAPGSSTHQGFNYLMGRAGLAPDSYTPIAVGNSAGSVAATKYGKVDANVIVEPIVSLLQAGNDATLLMDGRTEEKSREAFGGPFPEGGLYAREDFIKKNPRTIQALANGLVRANEWLQTASPADVAATVPEGFLLGDKAIYEKSFEGIRETISPDGMMPPGAQENCLKFLADADPKIAADRAKIKLEDTWTNEFALRAKKHA